jgi:hypothetical protein
MITIDEITLPRRSINLLQDASTLRVLKLNNSLAKKTKSTQDTIKRAMQILDAKSNNPDLQSIVRDNCKHRPSADHQKKLLQLLVNTSCFLMAP